MRQERKATFLKGLFWTLILTLFLISFSVVFTLYMEPLYWADIRLMGLEKASGRSAEVIRKNYHTMVSYMYLWNRTPVLSLPDFAMSQGGKIHFADCKRIFDAVQMICAVSGLLTILSAVGSPRRAGLYELEQSLSYLPQDFIQKQLLDF